MYTPEFQAKLTTFCTRLFQEQQAKRIREFPNTPHLHNEPVEHNTGRVYSRVLIGRAATYFVRVEDGAIFAAKSFKAVNKIRQYGTLDTIDQFDWSGYNAVALPNSNFTMRMTDGHYMTAVPK
jgi:hypothetical protein